MEKGITPVQVVEKDFSQEDLGLLANFRREGCPGLAKIVGEGEEIFLTCFDLYMSGKTYSEISKIVSVRKEIVLFVSEKHNWFEKRISYYSELASHSLQKYQKSKLETVDTMMLLLSAMNDFFKKEGYRYHKTKDASIIKNFDQKMFGQYLKSIEIVDGLMQDTISGKPGSINQPLVNINMNSGTMKHVDGNTIELNVEPTEIGDILATLSKIKKIKAKVDT